MRRIIVGLALLLAGCAGQPAHAQNPPLQSGQPMPGTPAAADQSITIKLPAAEWNVVLQGLGELPLKAALTVLQDIQSQAAAQVKPPAPEKK